MRGLSIRFCCSAVAMSAVCISATTPATAEDFYAGKTLTMIIGSGSGGGYDRYGRVVGRYLVKHIPGSPTLVPRNMPGAGSLKAAEYLFNLAPKDGTTVGIVQPGALVEPLFSTKKFRFNPPEYEYVGSANSGTRLCVTFHTSKVKTFEDALKTEATMGGNAPGSATTDYALMLNNLAGTKFKVVNGYDSTSKIVLAMERGELDGVCGFDTASFASQRPDWYGTKLSHMIIQVGLNPDPDLEKYSVPSIWKYVSGRNREVAELILAQQEFHRTFLTPPGTPAAQLAILRTAFDAAMKDPEFRAEAKRTKLDIAPKTGQFVDTLIKKMYRSPKDLVTSAQKAMGR
ncbi:MAG: hypothetical protein RLZ98_2575 [Pseudomonadota bacterium]